MNPLRSIAGLALALLAPTAHAQGWLYTWELEAANSPARGALAGDLDGDGLVELALGEPRPYTNRAGRVRLLSGATGAVLRTVEGSAPDDRFGDRLVGRGDTNDGVPCTANGPLIGSLAWELPDDELIALGLAPGEPFYVQAWFRDAGLPESAGVTNAIQFTRWP